MKIAFSSNEDSLGTETVGYITISDPFHKKKSDTANQHAVTADSPNAQYQGSEEPLFYLDRTGRHQTTAPAELLRDKIAEENIGAETFLYTRWLKEYGNKDDATELYCADTLLLNDDCVEDFVKNEVPECEINAQLIL
jgi:hypothetical protein